MQFMIFKQRAQRLAPCHILEGLPGKAFEGISVLLSIKHFLMFSTLSCLTTVTSVVKGLGLHHKEIFVHTHVFHRGSWSQKTPQPG